VPLWILKAVSYERKGRDLVANASRQNLRVIARTLIALICLETFASAGQCVSAWPTVAAYVTLHNRRVLMNLPMRAFEVRGPMDLGDSAQMPFNSDWSVTRNADRSIDVYDSIRKCTLHFGCNGRGCPSIGPSAESSQTQSSGFLLTVPMPR